MLNKNNIYYLLYGLKKSYVKMNQLIMTHIMNLFILS